MRPAQFGAAVFACVVVLAGPAVASSEGSSRARAVSDPVRYYRAFDLGDARQIVDLGPIGGQPHIAIQYRYDPTNQWQIRVLQYTGTALALRYKVPNPAYSGQWGRPLVAVSDGDGDGVRELGTLAGARFYMLSGKGQPGGATITADAAAIYYLDPPAQPMSIIAVPDRAEFFLGPVRRQVADGTAIQTITGLVPGGTFVPDMDGDGIADLITGGHTLYLVSGANSANGAAADLAFRTFADPETPGLGFAQDENNIIAAMGDTNGDGVSEIAVGAPHYWTDPLGNEYGRVVVFDGATAQVLYRVQSDPPTTEVEGAFGSNVVAPGDMDGDGIGDLIVSARGYFRPGSPGPPQYMGGTGAIVALSGVDGHEIWRAYGGLVEAIGMDELTVLSDWNGDGFPELGVGSQLNGSIWLSCNPTLDSNCERDTVLPCMSLAPTLVGTAGDDVIQGTTGSDVIVGLGGNDTVNGRGGDDTICGGVGNDTLTGGPGADSLDGGAGNDTVSYLSATAGVSVDLGAGTVGGADSDTLSGMENVEGTPYADLITGSRDANTLSGEGGDDTLYGLGGDDILDGGAGSDHLDGGLGIDALNGGPDTDTCYGEADQACELPACFGMGATIVGSSAGGVITGTAGADVIVGLGGSDRINGLDGNDLICGGGGNDTIDSADGDDQVQGGSGNDILVGGFGKDSLRGGVGDDTLKGGADSDLLYGEAGHDSLDGGSGADTLKGGLGIDTLNGGPGTDRCNGETEQNCEL